MWVHRYLKKWNASSDDTGKCMVDDNSSSMYENIAHRSSTESTCGDDIWVVAVSM